MAREWVTVSKRIIANEQDVRNHYSYILSTHEPDRAIILTAICFSLEEEEVTRICSDLLEYALQSH